MEETYLTCHAYRSYGVYLWEIVTYGQLPLEDLDVQDIIERAQNESLEHPR